MLKSTHLKYDMGAGSHKATNVQKHEVK